MSKANAKNSFFQRNGLSVVFGALTVITLLLHVITGWRADAADRRMHGEASRSVAQYVDSGDFQSSLFENWESEFLQMALFVALTVKLRQKGSSESRPMDPTEETPKRYPVASRPWPVRRGGLWLRLYEHSLSLALFGLFVASFIGHWIGSWRQHSEAALAHGKPAQSLLDHLASAELWFESMQNWQSEFLSVLAIVILSVYLREKDSSQSKQVDAPHDSTGV